MKVYLLFGVVFMLLGIQAPWPTSPDAVFALGLGMTLYPTVRIAAVYLRRMNARRRGIRIVGRG